LTLTSERGPLPEQPLNPDETTARSLSANGTRPISRCARALAEKRSERLSLGTHPQFLIMQRNPYIQRGLTRAGFSGGWLSELNQLAAAASAHPRSEHAR
jgi:hypothetical protein